MGSKWNYRVVALTNMNNNKQDEEVRNDPQENVEGFGIIAVFYDEDTDKIIGSSDPDQAIMVATSLDGMRPEVHRLMAALEAPVLNTCDLPGHDDYVDPEQREVVSETFWSAGKAHPVGGAVEPLATVMGNVDIEPARETQGLVTDDTPKSGEPDYSKATATENDDRRPFATAVAPGGEEDPDDKAPEERDRNGDDEDQ